MRWLSLFTAWLCVWLFGLPAAAHAFSASALSVDVGQARIDTLLDLDVKTLLDVTPLDRDRDGELSARELSEQVEQLVSYVDGKLSFQQAGKPCAAEAPRAELAAPRRLLLHRVYRCERPLGLIRVENRLLMEDAGGHRVVTRFVLGKTPVYTVFIPASPVFEVDARAAPEEPGGLAHSGKPLGASDESAPPRAEAPLSVVGWIQEGVRHILIGLDHILFVLALMIGVPTLRQLVKVISAFTLAHSITLALGATQAVSVSSRLVESLIALSIVYVAYDNYRALAGPRLDSPSGVDTKGAPRAAHRTSIAFGFGLIHGFGFASVLGDLGLPEQGLWRALLGFNVGVELGQLALVAPMYPFLRWFELREGRRRAWVLTTTAIVGSIGLLWLLERALGLELLPL